MLKGTVLNGVSTDKHLAAKRLVKKYKSREEDLEWARRGLVGTVINGESIPLIQSRVEDGGFKDLDIIPIGADKVVCWKKDALPFQRGAWLRVYGIPIHAWNEGFFKICVLDCGIYLRSNDCSLGREIFDYARFLISTSSLEVVNVTENFLVGGDLVEIKIIEEWGFNMGEDACLFEEDGSTEVTCMENDAIQDEEDANYHVDVLVDNIARNLEAEEVNDGQSDNDEWCEKVNLEVTVPSPHDRPDSPNNAT